METGSQVSEERVDHLKLSLYVNEVKTLLSVQQKFNSRLDPGAVLQVVANESRRLTAAEMSVVYLVHEEQLEIAAISGSLGSNLLGHRIAAEGSLAGRSLQIARSFFIGDIRNSLFPYSLLKEKLKGVSFLVVPWLGEHDTLGVVMVASPIPEKFGKDELTLLELVLPNAGVAYENSRHFVGSLHRAVYAERRRIHRKLEAVVSQTLFSILLIVDVLPRLFELDPQEGRLRMEELRTITRNAVTEMRSLIIDDR